MPRELVLHHVMQKHINPKKNTQMQMIIYENAVVETGGKSVLMKEAAHGTQGTTPKNDRGTTFAVVYFEGKGWVSHFTFKKLETLAKQEK